MGFLICDVNEQADGRVIIRRRSALKLGGPAGLLAQHLPARAQASTEWQLPAEELLRLSGTEAAGHAILFDLSPGSAGRANLYRVIGVKGRTASLLTDLVWHFKALMPLQAPCNGIRRDLLFTEKAWNGGAEHYEYLRLDGGTRGGTWLWSEPPQALSATVVRSS